MAKEKRNRPEERHFEVIQSGIKITGACEVDVKGRGNRMIILEYLIKSYHTDLSILQGWLPQMTGRGGRGKEEGMRRPFE